MFIIFNIILLSCTGFAIQSTKCDCDIFQISYLKDETIYRNFTKQTAEIKGRPIYYSYVNDGNKTWNMIWWNEEKSQWLGHSGKLKWFRLQLNCNDIYFINFFCNCYLIITCFF